MKIAYTMASGRGNLDPVLADLADRLHAEGLKTCGLVQVNTDRTDGCKCDMDVQVLPDGPVTRISQFLGGQAKGCRLNPDALEQAVFDVGTRLDEGCDVLIVNKFGKHEAEGRGFRNVIARAMEMGVPVIVGTNALNFEAFERFSGGLAEQIAPDVYKLRQWLAADCADEASAENRTHPAL